MVGNDVQIPRCSHGGRIETILLGRCHVRYPDSPGARTGAVHNRWQQPDLLDRVIVVWLECHQLDLVCSRQETDAGPLSAALQRNKDAAQRRYLAAIKVHVTFRDLMERRRSKARAKDKT